MVVKDEEAAATPFCISSFINVPVSVFCSRKFNTSVSTSVVAAVDDDDVVTVVAASAIAVAEEEEEEDNNNNCWMKSCSYCRIVSASVVVCVVVESESF